MNDEETPQIVAQEDGVDIVSSELNPAHPEEAQRVEKNNKILANTGNDTVNLKTVGGFSKEGVQFMANVAKLSSIGPKSDLDKVKKQNFMTPKDFEALGYKITNVENPRMKTKCTIISKGDEVYISFRGTKGNRNILTDLNAGLTTSGFMKGRVHKGFHNAFKGLWPQIRENLVTIAHDQGKELKDLNYNITGHSMGGAIAKIAAMYVHNEYGAKNIGVVTFGDPRVFGSKQARIYERALGEKTVRVAQHHKDPITAISPGFLGYKHVGCQIRVKSKPGVTHKLSGYKFGVDQLDNNSMIENKSVSIFYHPSRLLRKLNEKTIGKIQKIIKNLAKKLGHVSWKKKERKNLNANQTQKNKNSRSR